MFFSIERLYTFFIELRGFKRGSLAIFLGLISVVAFPPIHFVPIVIISFVGLIWLLDGSKEKKNFNRQQSAEVVLSMVHFWLDTTLVSASFQRASIG